MAEIGYWLETVVDCCYIELSHNYDRVLRSDSEIHTFRSRQKTIPSAINILSAINTLEQCVTVNKKYTRTMIGVSIANFEYISLFILQLILLN